MIVLSLLTNLEADHFGIFFPLEFQGRALFSVILFTAIALGIHNHSLISRKHVLVMNKIRYISTNPTFI